MAYAPHQLRTAAHSVEFVRRYRRVVFPKGKKLPIFPENVFRSFGINLFRFPIRSTRQLWRFSLILLHLPAITPPSHHHHHHHQYENPFDRGKFRVLQRNVIKTFAYTHIHTNTNTHYTQLFILYALNNTQSSVVNRFQFLEFFFVSAAAARHRITGSSATATASAAAATHNIITLYTCTASRARLLLLRHCSALAPCIYATHNT